MRTDDWEEGRGDEDVLPANIRIVRCAGRAIVIHSIVSEWRRLAVRIFQPTFSLSCVDFEHPWCPGVLVAFRTKLFLHLEFTRVRPSEA